MKKEAELNLKRWDFILFVVLVFQMEGKRLSFYKTFIQNSQSLDSECKKGLYKYFSRYDFLT